MNIIIVGSGKVGFTLAQELSKLNHNITLIDIREEILEDFSNILDVNCICGSGVNIDILKEAGASSAKLIIATTGNDELNIVICSLAKTLGALNSAARIRNPEYKKEIKLLKNSLGIDRIINPEFEAAVEISRLFALPSANKVDAFANERVEIAEYTIDPSDLIVGKTLNQLNLPLNILFCGAKRNDEFIIPKGDFICRENDLIYLSGTLVGLNEFFKTIGHVNHKTKDIMIIGGSRMAVYLARIARKMGISVRIIEHDYKRSLELTRLLSDCLIICGDGTDEETLLSEELKKMDAFISLTDSDEENVLSAFYAKKQGVKKVIPKINRENYILLTQELGIESAVCPKLVTTDHMFRYVKAINNTKSEAMQKYYRIAEGKAQAVEFIVPENSTVIGIELSKLNFKKDVLIAGIVHGKEVEVPTGKSIIHSGDQALVFSRQTELNVFDDVLA